MTLLSTIGSPADLKALSPAEVAPLAQEIRDFLVENVSKTGGHLGPNLGVVELTIALHRVFDSPTDTLVFDTGHQAYVHKLLTGRRDFAGLRQKGGLSGYPARDESAHDVLESSHASAGLSWADGIAKANVLKGLTDRHVVAVVGDGSLTGGMAWEALNNIAESSDRRLIIVVNDNGRSYSPTIGGMAHHLDTLRTTKGYESVLGWGERTLGRLGRPGRFVYYWLRGLKKGLKEAISPQGMFEDLGIKYLGPIDGHDEPAIERALRLARGYAEPVMVHVITEKGRGYTPAERHQADKFHAVGVIHPETGLPLVPERFGWTAVFADELVQIAREREDVVAITAAMLEPVGLAPFAAEFPARCFDVGIAEQHAVTSAAGLAYAGLHPVVAVYATFMNRAFDQVLMDVALHGEAVTLVLDRAGMTGDDGASHNGMWDLAWMSLVPGLRVAAPRDEATLRAALRQAIAHDDGPTAVRYPKGAMVAPLSAVDAWGEVDVLALPETGQDAARILLVGIGAMAGLALEVAADLTAEGQAATVASPTWVLPLPAALVDRAGDYNLVVTLEDGLAEGGFGSLLTQALQRQATRVLNLGLPKEFFAHQSRGQLAEQVGLTKEAVLEQVRSALGEDPVRGIP
ncbi:MAG: 1-deoxy-D-xylulose-5-phosphate synthase [Promicromonosporaceae bacterium]|nr:1-deoxy-D-xylulose-5-phosphate synthase [Promicromonosporaceae bacterium]